MPANAPSVVFIGGGPRAAGLLERLAANRPELFDGAPGYPRRGAVRARAPAGSGATTSTPGLMLNSAAADVTMFTDSSVAARARPRTGPGSPAGPPECSTAPSRTFRSFPRDLREQLRALTGATFPTRQLQSQYLEWFFRRAVAALGGTSRSPSTGHRGRPSSAPREPSSNRVRRRRHAPSCGWPAAGRARRRRGHRAGPHGLAAGRRVRGAGPALPPGTAGSMRHPATPPTSTIHPSPPART